MSNLSQILAELEASVENIKSLESQLTTARQNAQTLVERYRSESGAVLSFFNVAAPVTAKSVDSEKILMTAAARAMRLAAKSNEDIATAAIDAAEKAAKKFNLTLTDAIRAKIEAKIAKKSRKSLSATMVAEAINLAEVNRPALKPEAVAALDEVVAELKAPAKRSKKVS